MSNAAANFGEALLQKPETRFLDGWDEAFMIGLPWVGAILTLGFWLLGRVGVSWRVDDIPLMLTGLIFIDGVHIVFTFVMLLSLPELKQWAASDKTRGTRGWGKGRGPWGRSVLIALALGVIFFLLKVSPNTSTLKGMATTWLLLELVGPAQHTIAQMRGISFLYNSSIRKSAQFTDAEKEQAIRCEKLERLFFNLLLAGEIFYWIPDIFGLDKLQIPCITDIHFVGGVLSVASCAALLVNGYYFPKHDKTKKLAFLFRVILFPLKMLTTIGGISLRAAHGTEYLTIFRGMVKSSSISKSRKTRIFVITTIVSLAYAVLFCMTWPNAVAELTGFSEPHTLLVWAMLGAFVLRFTHYYMDSVLYKMSDPATRAAVAPLLAPKANIPTAVPSSSRSGKMKTRVPIVVSASIR